MQTRLAITTLVAIVLAVLLSLKRSQVTSALCRFGFFLGLAALGVSFLSRGGGMFFRVGTNHWKRIALIPVIYFMAASPFIVLTETGFAGYRGFGASMRYVSLALGIIGILGLVSSFVIPYFVRHRA
jgi:hypothetical protein